MSNRRNEPGRSGAPHGIALKDRPKSRRSPNRRRWSIPGVDFFLDKSKRFDEIPDLLRTMMRKNRAIPGE